MSAIEELTPHGRMYATIRLNGVACPVTNMFDIDGNELDEAATLDRVCTVVALLPNGRWATVAVDYRDLWPLQ